MMDRMDCILIMIFFTSFHYRTFIDNKLISAGQIVKMLELLSSTDQNIVLEQLQHMIDQH